MNRFPFIRLPWLLASLLLSACATVGPDYRPPATEVPHEWHRLERQSRPAVAMTEAVDLGRWWQNLRDPLLTELVTEALQASPDIRTAAARLREARARRGIAAADRYPQLTTSGSASRSRSSEEAGSGTTTSFFSAGFDASWELDLFGGTRRGVEAAEADLGSAAASLDNARASLAAEVATDYVTVRSLQSRLRIARDNLASQAETLQLTQWRAEAGLVSGQDVDQARSNMEQTRAQIPSLERSLAEAEHALDLLLGKTPGTLHARLSGDGDLPALPERVAIGIPADTLRQRPDIRAAERALAAETARVGVAEAARYPAFTLSGSIGLEALTLGSLGNAGAAASSLAAGITAPLFDGGRLKSAVEQQDAMREQAQVAYEQAILTALKEVENALSALSRTGERSAALATAVEAARSAADMARQRYSAGLIDFQSVLDTERSVRTIEDSLASSRADSVLALIQLYKAVGGGWTADGTGQGNSTRITAD